MSFYNVRNLSYLFNQDCSVVITGDSLAYNRYDFIEEPKENAWDCPSAMKSWSFLLRDFLITRSNGWIPACDLEIESPDISTFTFKKQNQRLPFSNQLPMENAGIVINTLNEATIKIKGCPENLCFLTQPTKAALFETITEVVDLTGNQNYHSGTYYKWIKSTTGILEKVSKGCLVQLAGAANYKTEVYLTGSGSKTAEWMLENFDDRIAKYKPNLVVLIIGANNRRMNDPVSFKAALYNLLDNLKDRSEVILISPPHSSTTDPPAGVDFIYTGNKKITEPILNILKKAAFDFNFPYIDLFEFFSGIPDNTWRFDNTHFTKKGNLILFDALKDTFFRREI